MFSSTNLWLAITVIAVLMVCYILILFKLKPSNEPTDLSTSSEPLQDIPENLYPTRKTELLQKIKEERIKEYFNKRNRK